MKPELLQVMAMTDVGILDDDFRFNGVCVQLVWVAWVVVCALAMNVLHGGRQGCSFRVSVGFPLINRPTLFCLINENEKYFGS